VDNNQHLYYSAWFRDVLRDIQTDRQQKHFNMWPLEMHQ